MLSPLKFSSLTASFRFPANYRSFFLNIRPLYFIAWYLFLAPFHEDYTFASQEDLPKPFDSDALWQCLPRLLSMDLVNNAHTVLYEPTDLMLFQIMSLQPNREVESFVMAEVVDSYLHLLFQYSEDVTYVPSHETQIYKATGTFHNLSQFDWQKRKLRYIFVPISFICDAHTSLFVFDIHNSILELLDSDVVRRKNDQDQRRAEGQQIRTDPVLQEILDLQKKILCVVYIFSVKNLINLGKCMRKYGKTIL